MTAPEQSVEGLHQAFEALATLDSVKYLIRRPMFCQKFGMSSTDVDKIVAEIRKEHGARRIIPPPFPAFGDDELGNARLHPTCIVDSYLYADLALVAAAGGTGKTTTLLYEAVCIALGRPIWGLKVQNPGATLFITAEDSRELFAARLREIMESMKLTKPEKIKARSSIGVWDVSGEVVRLAELDQSGNIRPTKLADSIVEAYKNAPPVQIVFDPAISFGPGERIVNDSEQAIVVACRRIIRGLGCCVRIVHHTGKVNAGVLNQYASRGGSALPDGSRMVTIMLAVNDENMPSDVPSGFCLGPGDSGFILSRAKLSYGQPQPLLWIKRRGYCFEHFAAIKRSSEEMKMARADELERFLVSQLGQPLYHTRKTLEDACKDLGMSRREVREAIGELRLSGRVIEKDLPKEYRQGGRRTFLCPANLADTPGEVDAKIGPEADSTSLTPTTSPPYRERKGGEVAPPFHSVLSPTSPNENGEVRRGWRGCGSDDNSGPEFGDLEPPGWFDSQADDRYFFDFFDPNGNLIEV